ncbi:MAG: type III toxin-antitoxin system ToxN/AbiQ family toxin [Lachnospiraceae bacterium]|nr:type III toxin-antitoxin system ToxN/AbiQ family toxin [Lachnospiraceae bacterium]
MEQKRLNLYTVNMKYIRNLHNQGDDRVFSVSPQVGKESRPFVGIVIICKEKQYCIPLSSPKDKHKTMKNGVDFHRIIDSDGKLIGVLDFNNMIPVREDVLREVDLKINPKDSQEVKCYKNLMIDQLDFCRQNHAVLVKKAEKLYNMVGKKNGSSPLKRRCLKWSKLEQILERFLS